MDDLWVPRSEVEKERRRREEAEERFKRLLADIDPADDPDAKGGPIYMGPLPPGLLAERVVALKEAWAAALVREGPCAAVPLTEAIDCLRRVLKGGGRCQR